VGGFDVQPGPVLAPNHEEVVEQPALRRQQRAEAGFARRHRLDILGDQTLQEVPPIRPADRNQGSARKGGEVRAIGHDRNLGAPRWSASASRPIERPMARGSLPDPVHHGHADRRRGAVSGLIKRLADEIPNARFTIVAGPWPRRCSPTCRTSTG
jgi:hypothetical protein